ncbi:MAG: 16S rRNA (cytosine(967)-C(5))-methyltransferase RsmB [Erysipelotrichaceae bacterium]
MNERQIAYQIIYEVVYQNQYANLMLRKRLNFFSSDEKKLITQIVYGTISNYDFLQYQYQNLVDNKLSNKVKTILNMSIYQMFFLDKVPDYAIINDAVEISKSINKGFYSKVVNAVLRSVQSQGLIDSDDLSIKYSFSPFIVKMLIKQYDLQTAQDILVASNLQSKVALRYNSLSNGSFDENDFIKGTLAKNCYYYKGNIFQTNYLSEGVFTIQDEASQLVSEFMDPLPTDRILDMCSAPGTKTSHLSQLMNNEGEIIALELHEHRCVLIEETIDRLHLNNVVVLQMDSTKSKNEFQANSFDKILLDAPCSGLGVLKRKPEIKLHITPSSLDEIVLLQKDLLDNAAVLLKNDGILVYSTCTINKKENDKQISRFLANYPNFILIEDRLVLPSKDNDGFYMAKLKKVSE